MIAVIQWIVPVLRRWLSSGWHWLIDQPWGRWWKLPAGVLPPIASILTTRPPAIVEQHASWLAPIVWVLAVGVLIYGIDQSAREQARGQEDSLLAFSDRTADLFRQEGDRILAEGSRILEERQRRALEAAIAAESEEIADLEK
ncbi:MULTISPECIES: hypothetical protein [unclassified Cyanobium]|uniref:hypothetical protein n=1 Tax=unclassified Cyanobium TaxID=2627006 RepID=UPI0020CDB6D9|nr:MULTISPECIES: hypothetical protein [unclassified Cyanobium]